MGTPSTKAEKSVPWSRLKPRRKYWVGLAGAGVLGGDHARHGLGELTDPKHRRQPNVIERDDAFGGLVGFADDLSWALP